MLLGYTGEAARKMQAGRDSRAMDKLFIFSKI